MPFFLLLGPPYDKLNIRKKGTRIDEGFTGEPRLVIPVGLRVLSLTSQHQGSKEGF